MNFCYPQKLFLSSLRQQLLLVQHYKDLLVLTCWKFKSTFYMHCCVCSVGVLTYVIYSSFIRTLPQVMGPTASLLSELSK